VAVDRPQRPTRAELDAARGRRVPDVVGPSLRVLFCGINPGLYSAAVGHHFARPGNRFWKALHGSGFTDRLLTPRQEQELIGASIGITNLVARATASAAELGEEELRGGARRLRRKAQRLQPAFVALLGVSAYRVGFGRPHAGVGAQDYRLGPARVWVLPNPSGLNAHYQLPALVEAFVELRLSASGADG
jgi:double-stranded uracil-DNA glycosylase